MAKITLIGMYNWDGTLFDLLNVPNTVDKQTLIDTILLRSGEFEVLYPDFDFLKFSIGAWSRKYQPTFTRWASALALEYNPLENYDRIESWTDTNTGTQTVANTGTQTTTNTGTQTTTNTGTETTTNSGTQTNLGSGYEDTVRTGSEKDQAGGGTTTENDVSAYDSATLTPKDKQTFGTTQSNEHTYTNVKDLHTLHDLKSERTDDLTAERTDDLTAERTDDLTAERTDNLSSERTDDLEAVHEGRIHGNIGVTTSQQMLKSELDLGYWNIYDKIADLFLTEFVLPIY